MGGRDTAFLNVFRALAALWVVVAHCLIWTRVGWFPSPKMAVDLFMVLSGFLMAYTVDRNAEPHNELGTWGRFYIRRFFRIAPGYYFAYLMMGILLVPVTQGYLYLQSLAPETWATGGAYDPRTTDFGLANIVMHVTFAFGLHPDYSYSSMLPDWSLSLEMQFYLAFPLIYLAMRERSSMIVCSIVVLLSLAIGAMYALGAWPEFDEPSLLVMKLPVFLAGILIYKAAEGDRLLRLVTAMSLLVMTSATLEWGHLLLIALVGSLAWLWLGKVPERIVALTRLPIVSFFSDCSYAAYLLHGFVIALVGAPMMKALIGLGKPVAAGVMIPAVIGITYGLSYAFNQLVERPGISLGRSPSRGRQLRTS